MSLKARSISFITLSPFLRSGFLYSIVGGGRLAFRRLHFAHTLFLAVLHRPPCVTPDRPLKLMAHGVCRNALRCGNLLKGPVFLGPQKQSPPLVVRQLPQRVFQRRIGLPSDQHGLGRLAQLERVGVHIVRVCEGVVCVMLILPVVIPIGLLPVLVQILRDLRRFGDVPTCITKKQYHISMQLKLYGAFALRIHKKQKRFKLPAITLNLMRLS